MTEANAFQPRSGGAPQKSDAPKDACYNFWKHKSCKFGDKCRFHHIDKSSQPAGAAGASAFCCLIQGCNCSFPSEESLIGHVESVHGGAGGGQAPAREPSGGIRLMLASSDGALNFEDSKPPESGAGEVGMITQYSPATRPPGLSGFEAFAAELVQTGD